jgi:hypothetical protein
MTISEFFSSYPPQVKWAALALLGVYLWFMVLVPLYELLAHDPKDKSISNSRSRWFLQVLIGVAPVAYAYYAYSQIPPPPPPEKPEIDLNEFAEKVDTVREKLMHPQVFYIPYPSSAQPVTPEVPNIPKPPKVPEVVESPEVK